jgi:hypothetical protein
LKRVKSKELISKKYSPAQVEVIEKHPVCLFNCPMKWK